MRLLRPYRGILGGLNMIKICKIIWKIKKAWFYAMCAVKKGHDKKNLCTGVFGGDRHTNYKCSECPYFEYSEKNKEKIS